MSLGRALDNEFNSGSPASCTVQQPSGAVGLPTDRRGEAFDTSYENVTYYISDSNLSATAAAAAVN